jgi:hypothetical protein
MEKVIVLYDCFLIDEIPDLDCDVVHVLNAYFDDDYDYDDDDDYGHDTEVVDV